MADHRDHPIDNLADYDDGRVNRARNEHPELYDNHLRIAQWIDGWREGNSRRDQADEKRGFQEGVDYALKEVAAHLRQADLVPGGTLLERR